jgi:hypothetical protein
MCDTVLSHPILSLKAKMNPPQELKSESFRKRQKIVTNVVYIDAPRLANSVLPHAIFLANYIPTIITKLGEEGCLVVSEKSIEYFSPEKIEANEIKSVTGAGDWYTKKVTYIKRHIYLFLYFF